MKPKIYLFKASTYQGMASYVALSQDGIFLAQHICSSEWFARKDMQSSDKLLKYSNHYKDGCELVFISEYEIPSHEALQKAIGIARGAV